MQALRCPDHSWNGVDLSECFRRQYLDTWLPAAGLVLSATALVAQNASRNKRHRATAKRIARLDPSHSDFDLVQNGSNGARRRGHRRHGTLHRIFTAILPLNGPRLAARLGLQRSDEYEPLRSDAPPRDMGSTSAHATTSARVVYHSENAVILNEVKRVMREGLLKDVLQQQSAISPRGQEKLKRTWELVGSSAAAACEALATMHGRRTSVWMLVWVYLASLSLFTLLCKPSYFKHKIFLMAAAFAVAIVELRSAVIKPQKTQADVIWAGVYTALCAITLLPSLFFPYHTRLPLRLRAIQENVRAQLPLQEARTAIPTPRRQFSPRASGDASANGTLEAAMEGKTEMGLLQSPENKASIFSRAVFGFVTPTLWKHYWIQFTLDAVPDMPPGSHAAAVVAAFRADNTTGAEKGRSGHGVDARFAAPPSAQDSDDLEDEIEEDLRLPSQEQEHLAPSQRSLALRLLRHFLGLVLLQVVWSTIEATASLTPPVAMRLILTFIAERSHNEESVPMHVALLYPLLLGAGQMLAAISASQALYVGRIICVRSRAVLLFEIINKALRRRDTGSTSGNDEDGSTAKGGKDEKEGEHGIKRATDGEVTNFVAIDVFRVAEIGAYLHFLFPEAPIQIGLCVYLLINLLGPAALVGLGVIVLCMPFQAYAARLFSKWQQRTLEATDSRLNLATEVLNCIKTVKFFAWEGPFEKRLNDSRENELRNLRTRYIVWILNYFFYLVVPTLVTLATFAVHTLYLKRPLPAETAFTALALFNALRSPLESLPDMFVNVLSAAVSLKRIDKFLREEETTKYEQLRPEETREAGFIGVTNGTFTFNEDETIEDAFCLRDINVRFPRGELTIIGGPVGAGKTALLLSLLGETRQLSGRTIMPCAVARSLVPTDPLTGLSETLAYCPQSPWLLGATIKENILFGQPYTETRYRAVLKACALEADLAILEYDDETEVGEKGTALSGGQKARVALARAIYSPARYILLDDVLSAVDAHTAKHLYRHCLKGPLTKGRTIIMVTHAISLCLPGSAFAIALKDGRIVASGNPGEIQASGVFEDEVSPSGTQTPSESSRDSIQDGADGESPLVEELDESSRQKRQAEMKIKQDKKALHASIETYGKGNIGMKAYKLYLTSFAGTAVGLVAFWVFYTALFAGARGMDIANASWLREWASKYELIKGPRIEASDDDRTKFYLTIYALLALSYVAASLGRDAVCVYGSLQASRRIYRRLINTIVYARPQWFDRTPIGRIMNRLSKDIETIDQDIAATFVFFVDVCLQTLVIMLVACYVVPSFSFVALVILAAYGVVGSLYITSSRDLKRLESVTRSPIFTLVGEVLSGSVVIRAYGDASRFTRHCLRLIDKTNRPFFFLWLENRWLSVRVEALATVISFSMATFLILNKQIDAALAGFVLSFTIQLVGAVLWVMRMYTNLEISANSVERVDEYLQVEAERIKGEPAAEGWPSRKGALEVENLSARYAPELPLVLNNLSFRVEAGQKIGICGRTGSGKSSLALALFRFLEAEAGRIILDGVDLSTVRLQDIRQRLTIIPQESQLFSGSVRFNLDPFGEYEDEVLWDALERCKLAIPSQNRTVGSLDSPIPKKTHLTGLKTQDPVTGTTTPVEAPATAVITTLDMPVEQGGKNFSAGQKQLLALARGLLKLRRSNLVLLDESTASLDAGSDAAVQRTIRAEMRDATLLVVAHRIRGIVSFDKVLVLAAGSLVEFDQPSKLMRKEGSAFRELCLRSGEFDLLLRMAEEADRERAQGLEPGLRLGQS